MFSRQIDDLQFDVDAIREAYEFVVSRVRPGESRRGADRLRSISLTHREGAAEPVFDGNNSQFDTDGNKVYRESAFTRFNEMFTGTYFWEIYRRMPFQVGRMRLMVLPPLTIYAMHRDSSCRAHIAITTNPDCRIISRTGDNLHVPVDGRVYVFDTRREHTAYNAGREERVHLTMSIADSETD
jgi:hypothetical protein